MYYQLRSINSVPLPAVVFRSGISIDIAEGGCIATLVDLPELSIGGAVGYLAVLLFGPCDQRVGSEIVMSFACCYTIAAGGSLKVLSSRLTDDPLVGMKSDAGEVVLELLAEKKVLASDTELVFEVSHTPRQQAQWEQHVLSSWPRVASETVDRPLSMIRALSLADGVFAPHHRSEGA